FHQAIWLFLLWHSLQAAGSSIEMISYSPNVFNSSSFSFRNFSSSSASFFSNISTKHVPLSRSSRLFISTPSIIYGTHFGRCQYRDNFTSCLPFTFIKEGRLRRCSKHTSEKTIGL